MYVPLTQRPGETENLTDMENLTEESMLMELLMRYKKDIIYVRRLPTCFASLLPFSFFFPSSSTVLFKRFDVLLGIPRGST